VVEDSNSGERASLELAIFSTKSCGCAWSTNRLSANRFGDVMTRGNFLAGVNGGYCDPRVPADRIADCRWNNDRAVAKSAFAQWRAERVAKKIQISRVAEFSINQKHDAASNRGDDCRLGKSGAAWNRGKRRA